MDKQIALNVGSQALAVQSQYDKCVQPKPKEKNVLDEDNYIEGLQSIIVKDFFPDLPKLKAQKEYLDALEKNDTQKLHEIHIKYGRKIGSNTPDIYSTPATFETPDGRTKQTPRELPDKSDGISEEQDCATDTAETRNPEVPQKAKVDKNISLDKFMAKNTSEDNEAFEEIMVNAEKKLRDKHSWLYEMEIEKEEQEGERLALPTIEQQAILSSNSSVEGWKYRNKNAVMYVPAGVGQSAKEQINDATKKREIVHKNTHFSSSNPFNLRKSKASLTEAASAQALAMHGKIGADGKEVLPQVTPKVNGYGFVPAPSPAPGVDASPLMTWGEIEGTPFRLDGSDTPLSTRSIGPQFKIPDVPKRDRIGKALAEEASKSHRDKKDKALQQMKSSFYSPSPTFGISSRSSRLSHLSPAAQKLATAKLGIRTNSDKALHDSYTPTPSPTHRLGGKSPLTPTPSPGSSSWRKRSRTPNKKRGAATPTPKSGEISSLTDNLLQLPKRPKAVDYFE